MSEFYWNYRIVKIIYDFEHPVHVYSVREVHYEDGRVKGLTVDEISPAGEDMAEFAESWLMYQKDIKNPILIYNDLTGEFIGEEPNPLQEQE